MYVFNPGDISLCFWCDFTIEGECIRCLETLTPHNTSFDNSSMCSRCDWVMSKND